MRKLYLLIVILSLSIPSSGQTTGKNAPKPLPNNYLKSKVVVQMKDGQEVHGTLKSVIHPILNYILVKEDDTKRNLKLTATDIETVTVLPFKMKKSPVYSDTTVFTRVDIQRVTKGKTEVFERWLRVDYQGRNVSLYSTFFGENKYSDMPGGKSAGYREFFLKKTGEAVAYPILIEGAGTVVAFGRAKLYAEKFQDYPEIAEKILDKEFDIRRGPYNVVVTLDEYLD